MFGGTGKRRRRQAAADTRPSYARAAERASAPAKRDSHAADSTRDVVESRVVRVLADFHGYESPDRALVGDEEKGAMAYALARRAAAETKEKPVVSRRYNGSKPW